MVGGNAATAVVWNPVRQRFYATVRFHGVYESTDGMTWKRLAAQPGTGMSLTACPTNPGSTGSPACPVFRGALAVQTEDGRPVCADDGPEQPGPGALDGCVRAFGDELCEQYSRMGDEYSERDSGDGLGKHGDSAGATTTWRWRRVRWMRGIRALYVGTSDLYRCTFANGSGAGVPAARYDECVEWMCGSGGRGSGAACGGAGPASGFSGE